MAEKQRTNSGDRRPDGMPVGTPFKPGVCPNPAGRPPNEGSVTYWLKKLLAAAEENGEPVAQAVAQKVLAAAKNGNLKAIQELLDRTEGKPAQTIRGEEGRPVPISLIEVVKPADEPTDDE